MSIALLRVLPLLVLASCASRKLIDPAACGPTTAGSAVASWLPAPGTTWEIQLDGALVTSYAVQVYDIDLFDTPAATIAQLHAQGRKVICYFSAGSWEDWRPDAAEFPPDVLADPLDGWPGEQWLDVTSPIVRMIMVQRMQLAVQKGCDGVDPDNVDEYENDSGLPLTASCQLNYDQFQAQQAHLLGLTVGLKNDVDQIPQLIDAFDFTVNEQCFENDECDAVEPFLTAGKAVFQIEYGDQSLADADCPQAKALGFDTVVKDMDLDSFVIFCP